MTEEQKKEEQVQVSEETVKEINKEVDAQTDAKIEAAKEEVKEEVKASNDKLKEELAKIREEAERVELERNIAMEKAKLQQMQEQPIQKHQVPESQNPTQSKEEVKVLSKKLKRIMKSTLLLIII